MTPTASSHRSSENNTFSGGKQVTSSTVSKLLKLILAKEGWLSLSSSGKRKNKQVKQLSEPLQHDLFYKEGSIVTFLSSLLDVLLMKKTIENRVSLIGPLFEVLKKVFSDDCLVGKTQNSSEVTQTTGSTVSYVQQAVLSVLEYITTSLLSAVPLEDNISNKLDMKLFNPVFFFFCLVPKLMDPSSCMNCIYASKVVLTTNVIGATTQIQGFLKGMQIWRKMQVPSSDRSDSSDSVNG